MVIVAVYSEVVREAAGFEACLAAASPDRRALMAALKPEDQLLSLCAVLALDTCLRTVGLRGAETRIGRTRQGKPVLRDHPQWHISLSHSGAWGVCVLDDAPVGIDVQQYRAVRIDKLAARFYAPQETAWLSTLPGEQREREFFRLWSAKESLLKAKGTGLSGGLSVPVAEEGVLCAPPPWQLCEYALPGHALTVCGTGEFPKELHIISSCDSVLPR